MEDQNNPNVEDCFIKNIIQKWKTKCGRLFYDKTIIQKMEDQHNPNVEDCFMIQLSSRNGRPNLSKIWKIVLWWKYHPKVEDQNNPNVDHYYSFRSLYRKMRHFHPLLDWNIMWVKIFQKWMKIGPQFPSIFGSGTYLPWVTLLHKP